MFDTYLEIFTERARQYHSVMTMYPSARAAEFEAAVEPIECVARRVVCDMPAGGCYLRQYLPPGVHYVAVEPVERFTPAAVTGATILNDPITCVTLPDSAVDCVISLAGLHHEPSLEPVFHEMRRLGRKGGRVVIADVAAGSPPARFLNCFVASNNPLGHDGRFLDEHTVSLLQRSGLRVTDDQLVGVPWRFKTVEDMATFSTGLFGLESVSSEAVIDELARTVGIRSDEDEIMLDWTLRRIVCDIC